MQNRKKRVLTILVSWLESTRTPHQIAKGDPQVDILIGGVPIFLDDSKVEALLAPVEDAMTAFWDITEKAGVGKPHPQFRPQHKGALAVHEDNDLVAMRHTEFRRVPNQPEIFNRQDYKKIVNWAAGRFYRFNKQQLMRLGYELEDLKTYAWLYTMNFHGLWRDVTADDEKNGKALCNYLHQKFFTDFRRLVGRNCQNVIVDAETVALSLDVESVYQYEAGLDDKTFHMVAVSVKNDPTLDDDFSELPLKTKMNSLTKVLKTRRSLPLRLEAEQELMRLPSLNGAARIQIRKFHLEQLPVDTDKAEHQKDCLKCRLLDERL